MLSDKFNLLELLDIALRLPEPGAINFNILHTVISHLIIELNMDQLRPLCFIQDEAAAQAAITKGKLQDPLIKTRKSVEASRHMKDPKEKLQAAGIKKSDLEEIIQPMVEDIQKSVIKEIESNALLKSAASSTVDDTEETEETKELEKSRSKQTEKTTESEESHAKQTDKTKELEKSRSKQTEKTTESRESHTKQTDETKEAEESQSKKAGEAKEPRESRSKLNQSELLISLPDSTKDKDLDEITDKEKAAEVRAVAEKILQETSHDPAKTIELLQRPPEEEAGLVATKALRLITEEDLFEAEPAKVIEEMWRATNINRRMDGAEITIRNLSRLIDDIIEILDTFKEYMSKLEKLDDYFERIRKLESKCEVLETKLIQTDEFTRSEVERLEEVIDGLKKELDLSHEALKELQEKHQSLSENVAYKIDLEELKNNINEEINIQVKKLKKKIRELQDSTVRKEDFAELVQRVDTLESDKVSREELGRLLEPGFIDRFIQEQENLRTELDELKLTVASVDEKLNSLIKRIDEEILKEIQQTFDEIRASIAEMKEKLDQIDIDDINDSFARLEEQVDLINQELESIRAAQEKFEKEAKANFKKISDVSALIRRLETTKADKSKMYELLELKADLEMVMGKLDRSEFASVMQDMEERMERLTITVKINEENMNETFSTIKRELSFKMYTEDFIIGTEPIRNRIKAMIYEQKRIKEIALQNFFPDAPGVVKCFSCKRAANLIGSKCPHSEGIAKTTNQKNESKEERKATKSAKDNKEVRFPSIDVDEITIPPPDKPRIQDIHQLPVLFANMSPQVGLAHEKRKKDIDKEIAEYFSSGRLYAIGGEHTKTGPQQRGLAYTTIKVPQEKKIAVLLTGSDKRYYKGTVTETSEDNQEHHEQQDDEEKSRSKDKVSIPKSRSKENSI